MFAQKNALFTPTFTPFTAFARLIMFPSKQLINFAPMKTTHSPNQTTKVIKVINAIKVIKVINAIKVIRTIRTIRTINAIRTIKTFFIRIGLRKLKKNSIFVNSNI